MEGFIWKNTHFENKRTALEFSMHKTFLDYDDTGKQPFTVVAGPAGTSLK